jgi:hypothetical protein
VHKGVPNRVGLVAVAGCIALGAAILAGWGGGADGTSTGAIGASGASGPAPLTEGEFVSQANVACKESNDAITALKPAPTGAGLPAIAPHLAQDMAIAKKLHGDLSALTPPSDMQARYTKLVSEVRKAVSLTGRLEAAARADNVSKGQDLNLQLQAVGPKVDSASTDLGLMECAKSPAPQG